MKAFITIALLCLAASSIAGETKFPNNPTGRPSITIGAGANIIGGRYTIQGIAQDRSGMIGGGAIRITIPTSNDMTISIAAGFDSGVVTNERTFIFYESKSRTSNFSFSGSLTFYL